MIALVLLLGVASAADPSPDGEVRRRVGPLADVNWTRHTLEVTERARSDRLDERVEQRVREQLDARVPEECLRVRLLPSLYVRQLPDEGVSPGPCLWHVRTATYALDGEVVLVAEVPLVKVLLEWSVQRAEPEPELSAQGASGVVIDARGLGLDVSWAPVLRNPEGEAVWTPVVWEPHARSKPPVVWVADPAHPAAVVAGTKPFLAVAEGAAGADVVLSDTDAARFRAAFPAGAERPLGEGRVVVVVD